MDKMLIELLANMKIGEVDYAKGTRVKVAQDFAQELIEAGTAKDVSEEVNKAAFDKAVEEAASKAVAEALNKKAAQDSAKVVEKGAAVEVKSPTVDPCAGYVGERAKYDKAVVEHAYGLFIKDVMKAGTTGEKHSEKLDKWVASYKAAGSGLEAGDDALGGFLLAPMFSTQFLSDQLEQSVVRPGATIVRGDARSVQFPMIDGRDHSSGKLFGNMDAYWEAENATLTASRPAFEKTELVKKKLTVLVHVSAEMQRWSPIMTGSMLAPMMSQVVSWKEDNAFINGSGAGDPLGLLNCGATESQAAETGQTAATIVYDNVLNMRSKLWVLNRGSVVWLANPDIIPQLAKMSLTIGTGGAAAYSPANVVAGQAFDSLMGFPIRYTEKCSALGTVGDLILTDLSAYTIFDDSAGPEFATSAHIKFLEAQESLRMLKFVDGQCRVRSAFSPDNGNDKSPIVTLATR